MRNILFLLTLAAVGGCAEPLHLGYDYGRAFTAAVTTQADLTRPSVANQLYPLYGIEGVKIRLLVQEEATQEKSGETTLTLGSQ